MFFPLLIIGIGCLIFLNTSQNVTGALNLSSLSAQGVSQADINILQSLYQSLLNNNLSTQQCLFMLSQALFETGLLTSVANMNLINNNNNFAGLTDGQGNYNSYPSIDAFVSDWIGFLSKGASPITATSLTDYNNRLVSNHYYTDSPAVYLAGLTKWYNLLSSTLSNNSTQSVSNG